MDRNYDINPDKDTMDELENRNEKMGEEREKRTLTYEQIMERLENGTEALGRLNERLYKLENDTNYPWKSWADPDFEG